MLLKHLNDTQAEAMNQVYLWSKTLQVPKLTALRDHFGMPFFQFIAEAALHDSYEEIERHLKIPSRSGKALLKQAADLIAHWLKSQDTRIH
jgi:hypothetical protein